MKKLILAVTAAFVLSGCQSTARGVTSSGFGTIKYESTESVSNDNKSKYDHLIGTSYKVLIDAVHPARRKMFYDGQMIKIKSIEANNMGAHFYFIDEKGNQINKNGLTGREAGVIIDEFEGNKKEINNDVVNNSNGVEIHGNKKFGRNVFKEKYGFESLVKETRLDGVSAYGHGQSYYNKFLGAQCMGNKVAITFHSNKVFAASGDDVQYSIYVDGGSLHKGAGSMFANSYKSGYFFPTKKLLSQMKSSDRIIIKVVGISGYARGVVYLNGWNEMFARISKHCK